ncbi:hypothetical protein HKD37_13G038206 [Glycine soja]
MASRDMLSMVFPSSPLIHRLNLLITSRSQGCSTLEASPTTLLAVVVTSRLLSWLLISEATRRILKTLSSHGKLMATTSMLLEWMEANGQLQAGQITICKTQSLVALFRGVSQVMDCSVHAFGQFRNVDCEIRELGSSVFWATIHGEMSTQNQVMLCFVAGAIGH